VLLTIDLVSLTTDVVLLTIFLIDLTKKKIKIKY